MEKGQKREQAEWRRRLRPRQGLAFDSKIDVFRFLDLPIELRDRVYMFAAQACSDTAPLRVRSQR